MFLQFSFSQRSSLKLITVSNRHDFIHQDFKWSHNCMIPWYQKKWRFSNLLVYFHALLLISYLFFKFFWTGELTLAELWSRTTIDPFIASKLSSLKTCVHWKDLQLTQSQFYKYNFLLSWFTPLSFLLTPDPWCCIKTFTKPDKKPFWQRKEFEAQCGVLFMLWFGWLMPLVILIWSINKRKPARVDSVLWFSTFCESRKRQFITNHVSCKTNFWLNPPPSILCLAEKRQFSIYYLFRSRETLR